MPRAFPVPFYSTTGAASGFPSSNYRAMSTTSPGTTDSTASTTTYALASGYRDFRPEAAQNTNSAFNADGYAGNSAALTARQGLIIDPLASGLIPSANDEMVISAGTWVVQWPISRSSGLTDGDVTGAIRRSALYTCSISGANIVVGSLIGAGSASAITVTTSRNTAAISISGSGVTVPAGHKIILMMFVEFPLQVALSGTMRMHTNSTTGARITQAPSYTTNMPRSLSDTPAMTDSLARTVGYGRALSDSPAIADSLARRVDRFRALADNMAASSDVLTRRVDSNRQLADNMAASSDTLTRAVALNRSLNDAATVNDTLQRQVGYSRSLVDNLSEGGGETVVIAPVFSVIE